MKITVTYVDAERLAEKWRDDANRVDRITQAALSDVGREFVNAATQIAGAGPYGRSFLASPSGSSIEAGSKSPMAALLEDGRRPGRRPPTQSIRKRRGGSFEAARRAADKIAVRGTRGTHTVRRANKQIKNDGTLDRIARAALSAISEGD